MDASGTAAGQLGVPLHFRRSSAGLSEEMHLLVKALRLNRMKPEPLAMLENEMISLGLDGNFHLNLSKIVRLDFSC